MKYLFGFAMAAALALTGAAPACGPPALAVSYGSVYSVPQVTRTVFVERTPAQPCDGTAAQLSYPPQRSSGDCGAATTYRSAYVDRSFVPFRGVPSYTFRDVRNAFGHSGSRLRNLSVVRLPRGVILQDQRLDFSPRGQFNIEVRRGLFRSRVIIR
jgi:hypothetical protein